jgi:hypothetical protein
MPTLSRRLWRVSVLRLNLGLEGKVKKTHRSRGFAPGYELEDWLAAEAEFNAQLAGGRGSRQ